MRKRVAGELGIACLILLFFCQLVYGETYKLSMQPRLSATEINKRIKSLSEYLSIKTRVNIEPFITANFSEYQKQLNNGSITIGYNNPVASVMSVKDYEVVAMAVNENGEKSRGIIITMVDSRITTLEEIRGKIISIVSYNSVDGYLSQQLSLLKNGVDIQKSCKIVEANDNKLENVLFSVFTGEADVGFISESAFNMIDTYVPSARMRLLAKTDWFPNWAVSVKRSIANKQKLKIQKALLGLKEGHSVLNDLKIKYFRKAEDSDYNLVRQALGLLNSSETLFLSENQG